MSPNRHEATTEKSPAITDAERQTPAPCVPVPPGIIMALLAIHADGQAIERKPAASI
jgi:hypothetical protein